MASESERASGREARQGGRGVGQTCPITPKFLVISLLVFGHYLELLLSLPLLLLSRILTFSIVIVVVSVVVVALLLLLCCCCCCTAVSC